MRSLAIALLFFLSIATDAQDADSVWIVNNYTKKEVYIPMRDGVKLFTAVYSSKNNNTEKHPILITRTPYSVAPYGEGFKNFWTSHYKKYLEAGYIMVLQDVRGRYMSEGVFEDVRPYKPNKTGKETDEASDTYDTIDWLVKNVDNNNGNVGVFGISYPGFYSTMAALSGHPALKAVSPQAPVTEWFIGDDFHHNGAFMLMDAFAFYSGFGKPRPKPTSVSAEGFKFPNKDNYDFFLKTGALPHFTKLVGDSIRFWQDLMNHPNYDEWWQARNTRNYVSLIPRTTATLVVGGLFDAEDCYGAWNLYKAIERKAKNNNKLVMGPWSHGGWTRTPGTNLGNVQFGSATSEWYQDRIEHNFFSVHLEGRGPAYGLEEATIFFTGENTWKAFHQWPPSNIRNEAFYLRENGNLLPVIPNQKQSYSEYTSDPAKPVPYTEDVHLKRTREYMTDDQRFAARRPDVLVFQTPVLENDVTVAGPIIADLMTSISTTDADFVVKLIDVFPDNFQYSDTDKYVMAGYQMLVRGEIFRGRYRNSFSKPEAFVPGKITKVKYELPDVAHTFRKGHRIMVQVQSSWFPLADRNPQQFIDIYHAKDSDFKKANIKIHHSAGAASKIILPVMK